MRSSIGSRSLAGEPSAAGERTARVLAGYPADRRRARPGLARPFGAADLAAVLATCHQPAAPRARLRVRGGRPPGGRPGRL